MRSDQRSASTLFAVWRLLSGRWSRVGVANTRSSADALAMRCGTLAVVLPIGAHWAASLTSKE
jgi:hypothetical protein